MLTNINFATSLRPTLNDTSSEQIEKEVCGSLTMLRSMQFLHTPMNLSCKHPCDGFSFFLMEWADQLVMFQLTQIQIKKSSSLESQELEIFIFIRNLWCVVWPWLIIYIFVTSAESTKHRNKTTWCVTLADNCALK